MRARCNVHVCICILLFLFLLVPSLSADTSFLSKTDERAFRIMVYNPYWNAIFSTGLRKYHKAAEFTRVLAAIRPDIAIIQEVDPARSGVEIHRIFTKVLPQEHGGEWHVVSGADNVIVSRYPITWSKGEYVIGRGSRGRGHIMAQIDLPGQFFAGDVVIAGAHFVSGGADKDIQARSMHADALIAHLRNAIQVGRTPIGTPVILAGDFNAYATDPRRHIDTLLFGDIADETTYGQDGSLDPVGAPMVDLMPTHNGMGGETWTWRDDTQQFEPYPLDRIIFAPSSLTVVHSFVLNTSIMASEDLVSSGLQVADVALNLDQGDFDHLPLVADFVFH